MSHATTGQDWSQRRPTMPPPMLPEPITATLGWTKLMGTLTSASTAWSGRSTSACPGPLPA
jgi:hypothetical protein